MSDGSDDERELLGGIDRSLSLSHSSWLLGFLRPSSDSRELLRHQFPSKVGGRPAWLDPVDLPTASQLRCPNTGGLMKFLLQVYAPVFEFDRAFHRAVFLFISPEGEGALKQGGCVAYRSQLPRENPYYSPMPPLNHNHKPPALPDGYVVEDPWRVLRYESTLGDAGSDAEMPLDVSVLPEYNLSIQEEFMGLPSTEENAIMESEFVEGDDVGIAEVEAAQKLLTPEQSDYMEFEQRISKAPDQCIRYCFEEEATPLLPNKRHPVLREDKIPPCERCGAPRQFEFQVLPQILHFLGPDAETYDWGSIVVYSCRESCDPKERSIRGDGSQAYSPEFVVVYPM